MELLAWFWDLVVHLDVHLAAFVAQHGVWVYALLFAIVFCETGLVVTPFLPGDSLLFVAGAVAAAGDMNIAAVMATLIAAALCGDNVNYWVGRWIGPRVFHFEKSRWFNPAHLQRTHDFYEQHGGKTIILARFVPIVRTYVPFVAGVGAMPYARYLDVLRRRRADLGRVALHCWATGSATMPIGEEQPHRGDPADRRAVDLAGRDRLATFAAAARLASPARAAAAGAWRRTRGCLRGSRARACPGRRWSFRRFSSCGLEMNAVSTRIDGTSCAVSTAKLACSTCGLCSSLTPPSCFSTELPRRRL